MPSGVFKRPSPEERFWKYVQKKKGCWEWTGTKNKLGYGTITVQEGNKSKSWLAHRFSFKMHKGSITQGLSICHSCDNPACVNPDHLWEGTHQENMRDRSLKGRVVGCKGEENPRAKLTRNMVEEIRNLYKTGEFSHNALAQTFHVSKASIYYIVNGKNWKNI